MAFKYMEIIEEAILELDELKGRKSNLELEKAEIEAKMDALSETIRALAPMTGPVEEQQVKDYLASLGDTSSPVGITDRIRSVLRNTLADQLSPAEVKDALESSGWDLAHY